MSLATGLDARGRSLGIASPDLSSLLAGHRLWSLHAFGYLILCVLFAAAMLIDDRQFQDVNLWKKPAKFALSIGVYLMTLAWCAALAPSAWWRSLPGRAMTGVALGTAAFEMAYIAVMAGLGEASHFNVSTPFTSVMYSLMGIGAMTLTAISLWLSVIIARALPGWRDDPVAFSIVVGLALTFFLGAGFGAYLGAAPSHWVAAPATDAGGLPLFDWTRQGGDLRVAHFFGLHAMQVLPLFAVLVRRRARAGLLVRGFACLWTLLCVGTFVQALLGRPLIA